ncbi:MAG: RodZ domain-containing protein [Amphritea sp.]
MRNNEKPSVDTENQSLVFPADELVKAREAQGISRQDVARELRLSEKYIEAIENSAFDDLPSLVFARGYIASYCKVLNLSDERFLADFDALNGRAGKTKPFGRVTSVGQQAKLGDPVVRGSAWFFVLVVIAASVWWWKTQNSTGQIVEPSVLAQYIEVESVDGLTLRVDPVDASVADVSDQPIKVDSVVVDDVVVDPAVNPIAEQALPLLVEAEDTVSQQNELLGQAVRDNQQTLQVGQQIDQQEESQLQAVDESSKLESVQAAVAEQVSLESGMGRLQIDFIDDCWISVKDASGEVLAMRVKPAGSKLDVSGAVPLKIHLGRVGAISNVYFNGEQVELNRASATGVVKLTLPL